MFGAEAATHFVDEIMNMTPNFYLSLEQSLRRRGLVRLIDVEVQIAVAHMAVTDKIAFGYMLL